MKASWTHDNDEIFIVLKPQNTAEWHATMDALNAAGSNFDATLYVEGDEIHGVTTREDGRTTIGPGGDEPRATINLFKEGR